MTRKLFLLLFLSIQNFEMIEAQWTKEKCPTANNLNAITFVSKNVSWVVGDKGTILCKKDKDWIEYSTPTSENLYGIHMLDDNSGWAVGAKGTIVRFDGKNWQTFVSPTNKSLHSVYFKDQGNGIAVGEFGTILNYKDGVWRVLENAIRGNLYTVFFENNDAWIGGGHECLNVLIMRMKYEENLKPSNIYDSFATINSFFFLDAFNGWAVGSPSTILHFDGQQWERVRISDNFSSLNSIFFQDEANGISVGYQGTTLIYRENNWIKEDASITEDLNGCYKIGNSYYAVGDKGTIITRKLAGFDNLATLHEQEHDGIKVFPNPCNEVLNISLSGTNENINNLVSISNSSGQVLMKKKLSTGTGGVTYELATIEFKNGLYFLNVLTGQKLTSIKFVIEH